MKQPPEPARLLDELEASGDLHRALSRLQANAPSAASMAAMAASLGVPGPSLAATAAPKSGLSILKLVGGVGLVVGAAIGGAQLLPVAKPTPVGDALVAPGVSAAVSEPAVTPSPVAQAESTRTASRGTGEVADERRAIEEEAVRQEAVSTPSTASAADNAAQRRPRVGGADEGPATLSGSTPPVPRSGTGSGTTPPTTYESVQGTPARQTEMDLVRDARSALGGSPAVALGLTEKHRREYPSGRFSQERELIAITALTRLGRASDAQERADRFRRDYPTSAYRRQIDQLVP